MNRQNVNSCDLVIKSDPETHKVTEHYFAIQVEIFNIEKEIEEWEVMHHQNDPMTAEIKAKRLAELRQQKLIIEAKLKLPALSLNVDELPVNSKRLTVTQQQNNAILKWLSDNDHDPQRLPVPPSGKAGVKKLCRDDICVTSKQLFASVSVFNTAWDRLRAEGNIKDEM